VQARSETRAVDEQLQASLRAASGAFTEELASAQQLAATLASDARLRAAVSHRDLRELRALVRATPHVRVELGDLAVGRTFPGAVERRAQVARADGRVVVSVPLDRALADRLRTGAVLDPDWRLLVRRGISLPTERPTTATVGGSRSRALVADLPGVDSGVRIAVLAPQSAIDAATRTAWLRLLAALAAALALVSVVAYLIGRSIVATLSRFVAAARGIAQGKLAERVPAGGSDEFARLGQAFNEMAEQLQDRLEDLAQERSRLRDATARFGEALASTHDAEQLLEAIAETVVESTSATGGRVIGPDGSVLQVGDPDVGPGRIELPLQAGRTSFGSLVLSGPEFSIQDLESASLLVGHAIVALDNARLHRIVEREARIDELTGIANRRAAERALEAELARSRRFGSPVALVLADLDGFKAVNDRFGHLAGDAVLREFADVLRGAIREVDLAARWGGEEFCLLLPGTDAAGAAIVAERVRVELAGRTVSAEDGAAQVTASFGVSSHPPAAAEELVAAADAALYEAKRAGKNRVAPAGTPVSA
jgi:diguanylate cyclase (GGDEF)-like protein